VAKYHSFSEDIRTEERARIQSELDNCAKNTLSETIMNLQPKLDKEMADRIAKAIEMEATTNKLDTALIAAIIMVESEFNPFAESPMGAYGLMQIRFSVWKETPELSESGADARGALFWIDRNIKSGCKILRKYYDLSNCNMARALYRYNTGSSVLPNGDQYGSSYVNKVMQNAYIIKVMLTGDNECGTGGSLMDELKEEKRYSVVTKPKTTASVETTDNTETIQ